METFAQLVNRWILLPSKRTNYVCVETLYLSLLLSDRLRCVEVDEDWYLRRYPDVVGAIRDGVCADATEHYTRHGYFEHRMPREIRVDEQWYLEQYDDVRVAVGSRDFTSAQKHFEEIGYREGRLPFAGFALGGRA